MNVIDKLRTRLRDMLFGRTRLQVIDSVNPDQDVVPFFVVGTFRSGTTLFRYLLDSHSAVCCPPETKYLTHFADMMRKESTCEAYDSMGFDEMYVRQQILRFANTIYGPFMDSRKGEVVVDKTPEYVRILDFLDWLYEGRCRYLLIFRNGLDVSRSMMSVNIEPIEADKSIDSAFEYWRTDTEIMLDWMGRHPERCHKVLYDHLCDETEFVLEDVMKFMELEYEPGQLRWYEKEHARGAEDIKARRQRSINKSVHGYRDWPDDVVQGLLNRAASVHEAVGYDPKTLEPMFTAKGG